MKRRLLNLLTALSLLMFVAVCVLWVRSYSVRDELFWGNLRLPGEEYGRRSLLVRSNHGGLYLGRHKRSHSEGLFWDCYSPNPDNTPINGRHVGLGVWVTGPETRPGEPQPLGILLPYWLLLALYALPPAGWALVALRRSRRRGLCPRCGHDLRATPECCPRCGMVAAVARSAAV